jgi:YQGE family putative transporter
MYLLPVLVLEVTLYRILYWLPYHVDFAKFTDKKNRGRQISLFMATAFVLGIFAPVVSGFLILRFGFDTLFIIAIIIYLMSGIPYLILPRTKERFSWSIKQTWRQLFSKSKRPLVLAYYADGAETTVGLIVWPIFIYQLLNGNYFTIGTIFSLVLGATAVMQILLGKFIDLKTPKEKVLKWGSVFYAIGWIIKIFVATAFQVFIVGTYHRIARIFIRTPFDAMTYEIAADEGHYVDEYTVLHEVAINFGKASMMGFAVLIALFLDIQWVFALAAIAAICLNLLRPKKEFIDPRHQIVQGL